MPALEVRDIDKRFGAVHAVRGASLSFEAGRIHAVVGENGAGKSTLLRIAAGLLDADRGHTRVQDTLLEPHTPAEAIRRGVAMVQQHFALIDAFTALENVALGREPRGRWGLLDHSTAHRKADAIARDLGVVIDWSARVSALGVGDRQRLEIVRALYREARVFILDEPTAVLTKGEADALYATLRRLADAGRAVVVVTHKLDEVRDFADVATVMRRGAIVETRSIQRTDDDVRALTRAIMGDETVGPHAPATDAERRDLGRIELEVRDLRIQRAIRCVGFQVRAGEIVGIAGVDGNGQRELVRAMAGLDAIDGGTIVPGPSAIAVVHEDRHHEGLVLDAPVLDNAILGELGRFSRRGWLDRPEMEREARRRSTSAQGPDDTSLVVRTLSGGNQQKLVVARAIARVLEGTARVLVVAHPTRGVDAGASRVIQEAIRSAAEKGAAVVVVSADLFELRALSHRILVLARGRVAAELAPTATDEEIGEAMLSGHREGPAAPGEVRP